MGTLLVLAATGFLILVTVTIIGAVVFSVVGITAGMVKGLFD